MAAARHRISRCFRRTQMLVQIRPNRAWDVVLLELDIASGWLHQLKTAVKNHEGLVTALQSVELGYGYEGGVHRRGFLQNNSVKARSMG